MVCAKLLTFIAAIRTVQPSVTMVPLRNKTFPGHALKLVPLTLVIRLDDGGCAPTRSKPSRCRSRDGLSGSPRADELLVVQGH
ncbi:hypothetical protein BV898_02145 [Hypsibius exemplaris]|uniref:Secreted protein n=1 Tax=Hypsibius exemplaris TaxID=2072580 RepID=A0A1W0X9W6_HYPEX|nr:hypothetical protein BV898_02145 [Hypsibius exemplaris]